MRAPKTSRKRMSGTGNIRGRATHNDISEGPAGVWVFTFRIGDLGWGVWVPQKHVKNMFRKRSEVIARKRQDTSTTRNKNDQTNTLWEWSWSRITYIYIYIYIYIDFLYLSNLSYPFLLQMRVCGMACLLLWALGMGASDIVGLFPSYVQPNMMIICLSIIHVPHSYKQEANQHNQQASII